MPEKQPAITEQRFFEDVQVGAELPQLIKGPYSVMTSAKFSSMNGDFYPGHYDTKWATEIDRTPNVVAHGLQITTYLSQLLTDWYGRDGFLRKFSSQVRTQTYVGDTLTFKGRVTEKYSTSGENCVECEVWGENQNGKLIIQGTAVVRLLSRE